MAVASANRTWNIYKPARVWRISFPNGLLPLRTTTKGDNMKISMDVCCHRCKKFKKQHFTLSHFTYQFIFAGGHLIELIRYLKLYFIKLLTKKKPKLRYDQTNNINLLKTSFCPGFRPGV